MLDGCWEEEGTRSAVHLPSRSCLYPFPPFFDLLLQADAGYLEGVVRGYKNALLTTSNYNNLTQCETLEGEPQPHKEEGEASSATVLTLPFSPSSLFLRLQTSDCSSRQQTTEDFSRMSRYPSAQRRLLTR